MKTLPNFLDAIKDGPFVFDGGMGTQLYERGVYINHSFDSANLSRQQLVRQVHEDYRVAGAMALTTNTFSSNRFKLSRHGLEEQLEAINRAAVAIARDVAGQKLYVAGSMGPTGQTPTMLTEGELGAIADAFEEQARVLSQLSAFQQRYFAHLPEYAFAAHASDSASGRAMVAKCGVLPTMPGTVPTMSRRMRGQVMPR